MLLEFSLAHDKKRVKTIKSTLSIMTKNLVGLYNIILSDKVALSKKGYYIA